MPISHHRSCGRPCWITRRTLPLLLSGLLLIGSAPGPAAAQIAPVERPATATSYAAIIAEASQRFGVPEHWIRAVIRVESRGDVRAVSTAGAMGLMQIMPGTWAELRARHRLGADPFDPRNNILAGTAYLREMYDRYGSPGFLAAYNAGPGRYEEYVARGRALPAETRAYVAALAPLAGGGDINRSATVIAVAGPSWTQSPLFVTRNERAAETDLGPSAAQPQGRPDGAATSAPGDDGAPEPAPTEGLFVARPRSEPPR